MYRAWASLTKNVSKTKQNAGVFLVLLFGLHVILLFKNHRKAVKNLWKIDKNRGLGRSRGPLGGHLGAFWTPWASKAEKVPKKLVRGPPLRVPRGTLKSHFFGFFL